jgi:AraC family transcriptional regulator
VQRTTPDERKLTTPDGRLDLIPFRPTASSAPLGWSGLRTEYYRQPPDSELELPPLTHHWLVLWEYLPDVLAVQSEELDGQTAPAPGSVMVLPAGRPTRWRWRGRKDSVHVLLDPQLLARVAAEAFDQDPGRVELPAVFGLSHPPIQAALRSLQAELTSGSDGGRLLAESLGNILAVHLVRHFAASRLHGPRSGGVLPRHKLRAVTEYVEEHLGAELTLDDLASVAHLSPYHFARLFKNSTGLPPHHYVIARRVERAKELLRGGDRLPLAEVAAEVGFADQGHFTRHFKRLVGVTPKRFL